MNDIERNMMLGMISILNEAANAYYNTDSPIMSDAMYDARLEDLKQLEAETGVVFSNSPSQKVGVSVLSELPEVLHNHPMLSLDKCHMPEDVVKFSNNKDLIASIKLDGMTISLLYENGVLIRAESRGNGIVGSDVTEHIKHFKNVPLFINKEGTYIVDGEGLITDEDFAEVNKDNEFKNSRNLCAGTLSTLDTSLVSKRKLSFYAWDIIEGGNTNNLKGNLDEAKVLGFDVVPYWSINGLDSNHPKKIENLQNAIDYVLEYAKDEGLPCDGVVFKFDDIEYGKSLGATSHHLKNGIAYKPKDEYAATKLLDIEWSLGKSGTLTPVAIFEEVTLDGSTVSRASVHNISILVSLDLHVGDTIEVVKSNKIIPQVKRNVSADERMALGKQPDYIISPAFCPVCGGVTEIVKENNSEILVCTNENCKGKLLGKLMHFVSKNAMNVEGLSESTLEKFIELGFIKCFRDIYWLENYYNDILVLDNFGTKSTEKLMDAIDKSRDTTLDRFIYALSIPLIGRVASKTIARHFDYNFDKFVYSNYTKNDWQKLDDFGEQMSTSLCEYIQANKNMMIEIASYLTFRMFEPSKGSSSKILAGKSFCITGKVEHFANREELKNKIEILSGKVTNSVTSNTGFLINNDKESSSSKNKKAKELGVKIINEDEFLEMIGEGVGA